MTSRYTEDRPRAASHPAELDHVGAYRLAFDLTPEVGLDEITREDLRRLRDGGEVAPDFKELFEGVRWRLQRIPISGLRIDYRLAFDEKRAKAYAAEDAATAPPILVGIGGSILDGQHRVAAAMMRGDATVLGYAPIIAKGAVGPLRHMVGNIGDSVAYCRAWVDDLERSLTLAPIPYDNVNRNV